MNLVIKIYYANSLVKFCFCYFIYFSLFWLPSYNTSLKQNKKIIYYYYSQPMKICTYILYYLKVFISDLNISIFQVYIQYSISYFRSSSSYDHGTFILNIDTHVTWNLTASKNSIEQVNISWSLHLHFRVMTMLYVIYTHYVTWWGYCMRIEVLNENRISMRDVTHLMSIMHQPRQLCPSQ
jgi:hypothetical protein